MNTKTLLAVLALTLSLFSCTKSEPAAGLVPKEKWADAMTTAMPSMLCKPKGFFLSCFKQSEDECLSESVRATKACLMKFNADLPAGLKQPEDGEAWGKKIGGCAGETMEIALTGAKKKIESPTCADPTKWQE